MTAAAEFDELMSSLTLGAGKLRMEEIIALQKTLAEACRIHDPRQADEMVSLLERMDVRDKGAEEKASPLPRQPETQPEPMSVEPQFVPPRGHFELGVAEQKTKPARQTKKVARNLDPTLKKAVFEQLEHRPVPPPPRKDKTVAPPPARGVSPLKNLQFTFVAAAEKGNSSPSTKENRAPPHSVAMPVDEEKPPPSNDAPPLFTLGKTEKVAEKAAAANKKKKSISPRKRMPPAQRWQPLSSTSFSWDTEYETAAKRYDEGDYERATIAYTAALESAPPTWALTAKALGNRGACNVMLGRRSEALFDCRHATKLDPSLYKAHNRLGRLELAGGDHKAAAACFETAKRHAGEKDDRDAMQIAEAGLNDARRLAESIARAEAAFARAAKHASASSAASSRRLSSSSTSSSPGVDEEVEDQRTRAERARDDSIKAACRAECERVVRCADEAVDAAPLSARAVLVKVRALATLERWTELEATCISYADRLAAAGATTKKHDDNRRKAGSVALALASASKHILLGGHHHHLPELYVISLRKLEQPEEQNRGSRADDALAALSGEVDAVEASCRERCRARLQRSSKLRRAKDRADSAYTRGHYRAAVAMYRDALMLDAEHMENDALRATLHFNLAAAALVLGRCVDAENHCSKALRLRPDYARARLRRARARVRIDQPNAALADFDVYLAAVKKSNSYSKIASDDSIERVSLERRKVELDLLRRRSHQQQQQQQHFHRGDEQPQRRSPYSTKPPHHQRSSESSSSVTRPLSSNRSTHYSVLGLASDCRPVEVKRAYAKLALQYHPDRNDDPAATATMARINEAYECLKDARSRAEYDATVVGSRRVPARYRPGWAR